MNRILVTGSAGFIGFHLSKLLLQEKFEVLGYDAITPYYDVSLKDARIKILSQYPKFQMVKGFLENMNLLTEVTNDFKPDIIIHLAAQAGVRYSIENPRSYIDSNIVGTFNIIELSKLHKIKHLLIASTSSVYGANEMMPFREIQQSDTQLSLYAATKKATESLSHSYAHLFDIPTTVFRFFTVYGSYGRPDLALFKFVESILQGRQIDVYNYGNMYRDFTYVKDLVKAVRLLIDVPPKKPASSDEIIKNDSLSPVAPHRIVNIGNSEKVKLTDFIKAIENCLKKRAKCKMMPMQMADVPATWANVDLLEQLTGYRPKTSIEVGIKEFVLWFREYYKK